LVSAFSFTLDTYYIAQFAGLLGKTADQQKYTLFYNQLCSEFHKAFYNPTIQGYAGNTLTANVLAITIGAVPPNLISTVLNTIVNTLHQNGNHSTCGIIGTKYLFPLLSDNGYNDLAITIASKITYPSYGWTWNNPYENATTLWETMNVPYGLASRNHIMFGTIGSWFYRYIGGIKPNALEEIEISPSPVGRDSPINEATVSYDSLKGTISVHWEKTEQTYTMQISVPSATTARIIIPKHERPYRTLKIDELVIDLIDSERPEPTISGIEGIKQQADGSIVMRAQPGSYHFEAAL